MSQIHEDECPVTGALDDLGQFQDRPSLGGFMHPDYCRTFSDLPRKQPRLSRHAHRAAQRPGGPMRPQSPLANEGAFRAPSYGHYRASLPEYPHMHRSSPAPSITDDAEYFQYSPLRELRLQCSAMNAPKPGAAAEKDEDSSESHSSRKRMRRRRHPPEITDRADPSLNKLAEKFWSMSDAHHINIALKKALERSKLMIENCYDFFHDIALRLQKENPSPAHAMLIQELGLARAREDEPEEGADLDFYAKCEGEYKAAFASRKKVSF